MVTKSGTNQLKGSGWYNYRRDWMNKNDFFRIKQGNAKPFFAVNIGGFSIGGPVVIPGLVDSRTAEKKTFFFGSMELTQDIRPTAVSYTNLPTARERAGDFSQTFTGKATGTKDGQFVTGAQTLLKIANPGNLNGVSTASDFYCTAGTGGISGTPCVGTSSSASNVINPKYFDPMGVRMLNLLPQPNYIFNPAPDQFNNANDAQDKTPLHTRKNYVVRMDQVLNSSVRFSGRMRGTHDDEASCPSSVVAVVRGAGGLVHGLRTGGAEAGSAAGSGSVRSSQRSRRCVDAESVAERCPGARHELWHAGRWGPIRRERGGGTSAVGRIRIRDRCRRLHHDQRARRQRRAADSDCAAAR